MLILGVLATFGLAQVGFAEDSKAAESSHPACRAECGTCAEMCEKTLAYCEKQGGKHADPKHLALLKDCIATCKLSEQFMKTGSQFQPQACTLCAEVCTKCAESCESIKDKEGKVDKQMQACAEECRKCAEACKKMAS
jgi:hypothetical protein